MEKREFMGVIEGSEGSESLINSAMMDARRRSILQSLFSFGSTNPLSFDYDEGLYNYEIAFNSLKNMVVEIASKLSLAELKDVVQDKEDIEEFLDSEPIWKQIYNEDRPNGKKLNFENWKELRKKIFDFAVKLKILSDKRGLGSPDKPDPRKAIIGG